MMHFESDAGILGEAIGIGTKGKQETLNFSADLLVPGQAAVRHGSLASLILHCQRTPLSAPLPVQPGRSESGLGRGFC